MLSHARTLDHPRRRRAPLLARLLAFVTLVLFAGLLSSAPALGAVPPEVGGLAVSASAPQAPPTPVAGSEGPVVTPVAEAVGVGGPASGPSPVEAPTQSGGTPSGGGTAGSGPGGASGGPASGGLPEGAAPTPVALPHPVETSSGGSGPPAVVTSPETGPGLPTDSGGSHAGTGVVQQPQSKGSGPSSAGGSQRSAEGVPEASGTDSAPPPSGGSPTSTGGARPSAVSGAPGAVPVQIVADTIATSPFAPARLAFAPGLPGDQPLGPGGTLARLVLAKIPAAGSLTLSCLTRSQTVRCALVQARPDPARPGLAYAGSSIVPPSQPALAPIADSDPVTPPPAGGVGVPGSGEIVSGSSSAASGASGAAVAAMLLLAATLLLGSPTILRRLLDVCERWLVSPLDLVLERPD